MFYRSGSFAATSRGLAGVAGNIAAIYVTGHGEIRSTRDTGFPTGRISPVKGVSVVLENSFSLRFHHEGDLLLVTISKKKRQYA